MQNTTEEYWNSWMTTDDHAYGSPKSGVSFTDLGTDHTFMMNKNLTGGKKIQMNNNEIKIKEMQK